MTSTRNFSHILLFLLICFLVNGHTRLVFSLPTYSDLQETSNDYMASSKPWNKNSILCFQASALPEGNLWRFNEISRFPEKNTLARFHLESPQVSDHTTPVDPMVKRDNGILLGVADLVTNESQNGRRDGVPLVMDRDRLKNTMKNNGK